ncbi:hypothetical protein LXE15_002557 [Enterococcus faecium]|nr:hypothetical protein [Enterococcus faecium]
MAYHFIAVASYYAGGKRIGWHYASNDNLDKAIIQSNYGILEIEDKTIVRKKISKSYYPGSLFSIELDLANKELYDFDEEEEFEWF